MISHTLPTRGQGANGPVGVEPPGETRREVSARSVRGGAQPLLERRVLLLLLGLGMKQMIRVAGGTCGWSGSSRVRTMSPSRMRSMRQLS